jgi:hypothetical protein
VAQAEIRAPHTVAFAAGYFMTVATVSWLTPGAPDSGNNIESLIVTGVALLWALMEAALYSLGCAWGGVSRPRKTSWALACGVLVALGFLSYAAIDGSIPPSTGLEGAKQQYTRGIIGVAYTFLAPTLAGLICAWISRRAR